MVIKDGFSRYAKLYIIFHKSDAAEAFKHFLADLKVEGIPSEVMVVRSDNGGEFTQGEFGQLRREMIIKQELTTVDSPEYNGEAERGQAMIESAALAARFQASELFPGFDIIPENRRCGRRRGAGLVMRTIGLRQ